jgi:hypothetical protein
MARKPFSAQRGRGVHEKGIVDLVVPPVLRGGLLALDFLAYWSASTLTWRGGNPYDIDALWEVERSTGQGFPFPVHVWNPPWTPILLLPFGLLPFAFARAAWFLISIALLAVSGRLLAAIYWPSSGKAARLVSVVLPLLAIPSWVALVQGQINLLVLFGIVGATYWFSSYPLLAGALLVVATVKPQLGIGALVVLAVWALQARRWAVLIGSGATMAFLLLILTILHPTWPGDYLSGLEPLLDYRTPTIATWAREQWPGLPVSSIFLALSVLSLLLLLAWARRSRRWPIAVAVGVVITMTFTVFGWSYDQIILLLPAYALIGYTWENRVARWGAAAGIALLNAQILLTRVQSTDDFDFVWVTPALIVIALLSLLLYHTTGRLRPLTPMTSTDS